MKEVEQVISNKIRAVGDKLLRLNKHLSREGFFCSSLDRQKAIAALQTNELAKIVPQC